ncbi:MAG: glycosyltransferase family 2 protein [Alphaproteobacteria bacterium]|nr:glycosyltransferase family 2 protein [Alphaproteobacteria bacterium]
MTMSLSVVVPVKNEAGNVAPLVREIAAAIADEPSPEIIFVDDGSEDDTAQVLSSLKGELPALRVLKHERNGGQSRAIRTGVRAARSDIIATLDGDGQNDPADIPALLSVLRGASPAERVALVSGVRTLRKDSLGRRLASRAANAIRSRLLNDDASDTGCGLKVFRREAFLDLPYFDNQHRYLIALMKREGYQVRFVAVNHRPRGQGTSNYTNLGRTLVGITDLVGVRWLQRRLRRPITAKEI